MFADYKIIQQIARNLYVFRKISGLSRQQVADKTGMTYAAVLMWERGKNLPRTPDTFRKLADLYGVKVEDIMELRCIDGPADRFPDMLGPHERLVDYVTK